MDQQKQEITGAKQNNKKKKHLLLLLLLFLLMGAGICFAMSIRKSQKTEQTGGVVFDPDADEYKDPVDGDVPAKGVSIPGWGTLTIPANETEITVDFYNPKENKDLYYLTYELRLPGDSEKGYEVLYTSGLIKPGLHIQKISLSHGLDAGEYDAVIHVQPYRMDEEKTPTNNADMNTRLVVQ